MFAPSPPPNLPPCWATAWARSARPPSMCSPRCAGSASTTSSSRSTVRKCRSGTAAPRRSSRRSTRPGITTLAAPRRYIEVLKPVRVAQGHAFGELRPYAHGFRVETEIEFDQSADRPAGAGARCFARHIPPRNCAVPAPSASCGTSPNCGAPVTRSAHRSRTRSSSPKIACSIRTGCAFPTNSSATRRSMRSAIWRWRVRRCSAAYRSVRGGHKLNHAVLSALMADPSAWPWWKRRSQRAASRGHADLGRRLAGAGLRPGSFLNQRLFNAFSRLNPGRMSGLSRLAAPGIFRFNHCGYQGASHARRSRRGTDPNRHDFVALPGS